MSLQHILTNGTTVQEAMVLICPAATPATGLSWSNPFVTQQAARKPLWIFASHFLCMPAEQRGHIGWVLLLSPSMPASRLMFYILPSLPCIWFLFYFPSLVFITFTAAKTHLYFQKLLETFWWVLASLSGHSIKAICPSFSPSHDPIQISPYNIRHSLLFTICSFTVLAIYECQPCLSFLWDALL